MPQTGWSEAAARPALELLRAECEGHEPETAALLSRLQQLMSEGAGPFRTGASLEAVLAGIAALGAELGVAPPGRPGRFDARRQEWFELRHALLAAESVVRAAVARTESRGAHQREDHPEMRPEWRVNQVLAWQGGALRLARVPVGAVALEAAS